MARVTVEDCIVKIPNRFELVICAAQRTRQISAGAPIAVERDNDKNPVVALREIAEGHVDHASLMEAAINNFCRQTQIEPQEEEFNELFAQETSSYFTPQDKEFEGMTVEGDVPDSEKTTAPEEE